MTKSYMMGLIQAEVGTLKQISPQLEVLRHRLKTTIANTVLTLRVRLQKSQLDLLTELSRYGLERTQSSVSQIERGRRLPSLEALYVIAGFLNTSTDYLLGLTTNPLSAADMLETLAAAKGEARINQLMVKMNQEQQRQILQFAEYLARQGGIDEGVDMRAEQYRQLRHRAVDLLESVEEMYGVETRNELDKEFRDRNIPVGNNTA